MTDRKELEGMIVTLKQAHDAVQSEFATLRSDHSALAESTRVMRPDQTGTSTWESWPCQVEVPVCDAYPSR